jgi:hypothetical protein
VGATGFLYIYGTAECCWLEQEKIIKEARENFKN